MFLFNEARPLILASLLAAFGVVGCQSTATTSTPQTDKNEDINHLISAGSAKPLATPTGLPITSELLERYDWQLVSAVSNTYDEKGGIN